MSIQNHVIVDASVAFGTTDPARAAEAVACLALAQRIADRASPTGAMMTPALHAEWRRHASRYMTSWLASMQSRGRIRHEQDKPVRDLRAAVKAEPDPSIQIELEKDLHLSEAAILHRVPVVSLDDKQKTFLARMADAYEPAGRIQWVNPFKDDEGSWRPWIDSGCLAADVFCAVEPSA